MPWVEEATKDVVWLRKASGSRLTGFDPEMSEWGNPIETNLNVFRLKVGMRFMINDLRFKKNS